MIIDVFAQNVLFFEQTAETNLKVVSASNHLDLHDAVRTNLLVVSVHDHLLLQQNALVAKTISLAAGNVLTLTQNAQPRVHDVSVTSYLTMWHEAKHEDQWPAIDHSLSLSQAAEAVVAYGAYDTLELTQEASFTISRNVSAENDLALRSAARAYKADKMFINDPTLVVEAP